MRKFADLVEEGFSHRPNPCELARIFAAWHPERDKASDLDLHSSGYITVTPWSSTSGRNNRLESPNAVARKYKRICGLVARVGDIHIDSISAANLISGRMVILRRLCERRTRR